MVKRSAWKRFLAAFFPERCCCCGRPVVCGKVVCDDCGLKLITIEPPVCPVCGCQKQHCRCKGRKRHTDRCAAAFYHEGAARSALHRLKFKGKIYSAEIFCIFMAKTVNREYAGVSFDYVVPVPLSRDELKKRRYNQSAVLAKGLSALLGLQIKELLVKPIKTLPQRELPAYRRSGNVLGVFDAVGKALGGGAVLLVDDTVTTGATLDECAKVLKIHGAGAVYAVTATASRL